MDEDLRHRITELVDEEHHLERAHSGRRLSDDERARLDALGVELDRTWDLLRRREARRRAGQDPDTEQERTTSVVEGYQQ
jgi:IS4 transposase